MLSASFPPVLSQSVTRVSTGKLHLLVYLVLAVFGMFEVYESRVTAVSQIVDNNSQKCHRSVSVYVFPERR